MNLRLTDEEVNTIREESEDYWGMRNDLMRLAADAATEKAVQGIVEVLEGGIEALSSPRHISGIRLAVDLIHDWVRRQNSE